jgi:hypothetical protein
VRSNWLISSANRGDRVTDEMGGEKEVRRAEKPFRAVTVTSEESDASHSAGGGRHDTKLCHDKPADEMLTDSLIRWRQAMAGLRDGAARAAGGGVAGPPPRRPARHPRPCLPHPPLPGRLTPSDRPPAAASRPASCPRLIASLRQAPDGRRLTPVAGSAQRLNRAHVRRPVGRGLRWDDGIAARQGQRGKAASLNLGHPGPHD